MDSDEHERRINDDWSSSVDGSTRIGELEEVSRPHGRRPLLRAVSVAFVAIVVAVAVVLSASGSHTKFAVVVLSEAAARTTGSGTARSSTVETLTVGGETIQPLHVEGSQDYGHKTATLTIFDRGGKPFETLRVVAGISYISTPRGTVPLPGGAHWVSLTAADVKLDANAAASVGSADPSSGLGFLSAIDGNPRVVDRDPLDGVEVTHYAFTLNLQSLFDRLGRGTKALGVPALGAALEQLKSLVDLTRVPGDAWIDTNGRVRRFAMTIAITQAGHTLQVVSDVRFSHFGEPVTVVAPAASDTVPFRTVPHFFSDLAHQAQLRA